MTVVPWEVHYGMVEVTAESKTWDCFFVLVVWPYINSCGCTEKGQNDAFASPIAVSKPLA